MLLCVHLLQSNLIPLKLSPLEFIILADCERKFFKKSYVKSVSIVFKKYLKKIKTVKPQSWNFILLLN